MVERLKISSREIEVKNHQSLKFLEVGLNVDSTVELQYGRKFLFHSIQNVYSPFLSQSICEMLNEI